MTEMYPGGSSETTEYSAIENTIANEDLALAYRAFNCMAKADELHTLVIASYERKTAKIWHPLIAPGILFGSGMKYGINKIREMRIDRLDAEAYRILNELDGRQ